ncbi:MAG: hypothetical protein ACUVSV_15785, partial [Armatimonadota bacterium]
MDERRTVIFTVTHQAFGAIQLDAIARIIPPAKHKFPPDNSAVSAINELSIEGEDATQAKWLRSNAVLHELTHLLNDKSNHCRTNAATCVWRREKNKAHVQEWCNLTNPEIKAGD